MVTTGGVYRISGYGYYWWRLKDFRLWVLPLAVTGFQAMVTTGGVSRFQAMGTTDGGYTGFQAIGTTGDVYRISGRCNYSSY